MPYFHTWVILLINQSEEIGEKQLSVFGSIWRQISPNKQYFKLRKNIFFLISSLTFKNTSGIYNDF